MLSFKCTGNPVEQKGFPGTQNVEAAQTTPRAGAAGIEGVGVWPPWGAEVPHEWGVEDRDLPRAGLQWARGSTKMGSVSRRGWRWGIITETA